MRNRAEIPRSRVSPSYSRPRASRVCPSKRQAIPQGETCRRPGAQVDDGPSRLERLRCPAVERIGKAASGGDDMVDAGLSAANRRFLAGRESDGVVVSEDTAPLGTRRPSLRPQPEDAGQHASGCGNLSGAVFVAREPAPTPAQWARQEQPALAGLGPGVSECAEFRSPEAAALVDARELRPETETGALVLPSQAVLTPRRPP